MSVLIQVLEQTPTAHTRWEHVKFAFVDWEYVTTLRLDGQCGVWLDGTKHGESHRLASTATPGEAIFFLLTVFDRVAQCRRSGGSWIVGHDGRSVDSIRATRFPVRSDDGTA
ncbi:MAG: hypothetical protein GXY65_13450 [Rhodococcus sp.]|uniref:hypothetical protein n=1 Tax=Rhodococcus TaxID=1827 RepID=UPI00168E4495|nr:MULTISPECIES: hypothetical protein [Rhodococcus]NLV80319.1 hypothetical protein [Rhodococcus sp. (in: high G+C Gram-positive bacteria)]